MRRLSLALLAVSPSPALESCGPLAQVYEPLAHDLFNAAFAAVWTELGDSSNAGLSDGGFSRGSKYRELLVSALMQALQSQHLPKEILQNLLNLAEFMEHDDKPLPLDLRVLGEKALKIQAYAKVNLLLFLLEKHQLFFAWLNVILTHTFFPLGLHFKGSSLQRNRVQNSAGKHDRSAHFNQQKS